MEDKRLRQESILAQKEFDQPFSSAHRSKYTVLSSMPDTQIKSIALRNWESVHEAVVEFPEKGLILVHGLNLTSNGKMQSIGSGKTALGEAMSRALLDVRGRYAQLGHYSTRGKGNTLVTLNCAHKGKPLVVEMGFKAQELSKTGESLRFTYDGQQVWRDRIENTRADLVKLLTVPPDLAKWTVYLDGDQIKFDNLSQRASVELLMAALAQPPWTEFLAKANCAVTNMKREMYASKTGHDKLREDLEDIKTGVYAAEARLSETQTVYEKAQAEGASRLALLEKELVQHVATVQAAEATLKKLSVEIERRVALNADKLHAMEIERNRCSDEWAALKDEHAALLVEMSEARGANSQAVLALDKLRNAPKTCPTCGKPWDTKHEHAKASLQEAQNTAERAQAAFTKAQKAVGGKLAQVNAANEAVKDANRRLLALRAEAPVAELSQQYEDLETSSHTMNERIGIIERLKATLERGPDRSAVVRAEATLAERKQQQDRTEQAIRDSAIKLSEDEEALRVAEYWQKGFGPTGIPNMILKDAIGPLNETSRRISTMMTGGCIQVTYETSRELVSGDSKAELNILVDNPDGADRADGGSKGESSLTNLIVAETLAEVGGVATRLGYRWYDEIGSNADEVVRRSIFAYLKEVASRYGILVFVVSHATEVASYADYVLIAEKTQKGTTYRWE
jgi:hypothetical protein